MGTDLHTSSHWTALIDDISKRGIRAAFNIEPPYVGWRRAAHRFFQIGYERHGRHFPAFSETNRLSFEIAARQNRGRSLDLLRQALTLSMVDHVAPLAVCGKTWKLSHCLLF